MPLKRKHDPGYKLPSVIEPEENCCICIPIPNDFNHKMAFLGQLDELGYWWNWERDELKQGREAAAVWREIVACIREDLNMSDCGCGSGEDPLFRSRFNPVTGEYEESTNGGDTWTPEPNADPRNSGSVFPPTSPGVGDTKKCEAANSIVSFFQNAQGVEKAQLDANASVAEMITALIGIMAAAGLIFAVVPGVILGFLAFLVNTFAHLIPEDFDSQFTVTTWNDLLCILYCEMDEDGTLTDAGWLAVKVACEAEIGGYAGIWLKDHINAIGVLGTNNAGRANWGGALDCDGCGCGSCASKYIAGVIGGIPRATNITYGGDWIEFDLYDNYGYIMAETLNDCCFFGSFEVISGTANATGFVPCGGAYPDDIVQATGVGQCAQWYEFQGSNQARVRVHLGECP